MYFESMLKSAKQGFSPSLTTLSKYPFLLPSKASITKSFESDPMQQITLPSFENHMPLMIGNSGMISKVQIGTSNFSGSTRL